MRWIFIEYSEALDYYKLYQNGVSTFQLEKLFGHNHSYFLSNFKKYGFEIRSNKINSRKYKANFSYFQNIDSHEKSYWLGYIYADGYVMEMKNGRKRFGMTLSSKDKSQLEKLKKCLEATYPIKDYEQHQGYSIGSTYSRLIIDSEEMFDDLVSHGVLLNKTNIIKPPNIDKEFISSFILGYFDGDGSIFLNNCKSPFYSICIVGTDELLAFIHNYFVELEITNRELHLEKRKENQNVSYIRYGGNNLVARIMEILYENIDLSLPLERKRQLYLNCKNRIF